MTDTTTHDLPTGIDVPHAGVLVILARQSPAEENASAAVRAEPAHVGAHVRLRERRHLPPAPEVADADLIPPREHDPAAVGAERDIGHAARAWDPELVRQPGGGPPAVPPVH